jgi:regulator of sigma E protease
MFIAIAILGIGLLIFIHELGHFLTAKAFGMRAEKFYIGFPPAVLKKKIGETEYGVGFVPLGGYVKISGMTREEEVPEDVRDRAYYAKPVWQRVIVISAGALMNVLLAIVLFFLFYLLAVPEFRATNEIATVLEGSAAQMAGMQEGDRLLSVSGVGSEDTEALRQALRDNPNMHVPIEIDRNGERIKVTATLGRDEETGQGVLGIAFQAEQTGTRHIPPGEALRASVSDIAYVTKAVFIVIKDLFVSEETRSEITSPIGIVTITSQTIELGWGVYMRVLGFISLQLAILNLLPLLPLDGGHVLFNVIEKIRGKPVQREVFEKISLFGLLLVGALFLLGIFNDIQRFLGPGFDIQP